MKRIALFISAVFLAACAQDPIFMMISNEVEPKDPLISGSPSKLVKAGNDIYVANGKLWKYASGGWSRAGGPSNVYDIAAAGTTLYMLSIKGSRFTVYKRNGTVDTPLPNSSGYGMIQGIYSDGSKLYAGGKNGSDSYALLEEQGGSLVPKRSIDDPLTGVAGDYYATAHGIYRINDGVLVGGSSSYSIAGIIRTMDNKTIAVSAGGTIFDISGTNATTYNAGYNFTGALAEYKPVGGTRNLLLIGIKGGVYSMGYREMWFTGDGAFTLRSPGGSAQDSSIPIADYDKYSATLAKCAVNSLLQADKGAAGRWPLIFASTQKNGLWSYRGGEWNAEE
ncbi:MAG: hypothetical protein LBO04_01340 [Spirochaetaceae bacterium]|jgi:hypothetical protein|nr:hypothetical protein [Spirochaetaceae bacterium]